MIVLLLAIGCFPEPGTSVHDPASDHDGDGVTEQDGDCDDDDATRWPGAEEACDEVDHDCDGDAWNGFDPVYVDRDGDGLGAGELLRPCDTTDPTSRFDGDCDDDDPAVSDPTEWLPDLDGDGAVDRDAPTFACEAPPDHLDPTAADDCDDADADRFPGNPEVCGDGVDQDCDDLSPDCRLQGTHPANSADAQAGGGVFAQGALLADAGAAWSGSDGAVLGIGSSKLGGASGPEFGEQAWLVAWVGGVQRIRTIDFPDGRVRGEHSAIDHVGDLDKDGVNELIVTSACFLGETPLGVLTPDCDALDDSHPDYAATWLIHGGLSQDVSMDSPPTNAIAIDGPPNSCPGMTAADLSASAWAIAGGCADDDDGRIWIMDGLPTGDVNLGTDAMATLRGSPRHHAIGWSLEGADVDGDGVDELVIGTYGLPEQSDLGFGMSVLVAPTAGLTGTLDAMDVVTREWTSDQDPGQNPGGTQLAIGDVDDDGTTDILVGMTGGTSPKGGPDVAGGVFVLVGAPGSGPISTRATTVVSTPGLLEAGADIATGDIDGDGELDLVIGAPRYDDLVDDDGRAWWIPGSALVGGAVDLEAAAAGMFTSTGATFSSLGAGVATSDLDGDGWGDVAIGIAQPATTLNTLIFLGGIAP